MDVHPETDLNSLEHVEDHCRELRPNGVLRSSFCPRPRNACRNAQETVLL
jgi:hypothetical protein